MMNGNEGHGWGMSLGMGWWWIIGIIALALIIWLVIRATNQNTQSLPGNKSSLDILKDRYAKGEIDKEEFEERKNNNKYDQSSESGWDNKCLSGFLII